MVDVEILDESEGVGMKGSLLRLDLKRWSSLKEANDAKHSL
jgi:hypothetical protein